MKPQLHIRLSRLRFNYFLALVLLIPNWGNAQNSGGKQRNDTIPLRFEAIGSEQGIPHNTVRGLYQDRLGFIWMVSPIGLIRYDGNTFEAFPHTVADSSRGVASPASIYFTAPAEDRNGDLWIGARGDTPGQPVLFFFDRETEKLRPLPFFPTREIPDLEKSIWGIHTGHEYIWVLSDRIYRLPLSEIDGKSGLAAGASFEAVELGATDDGEVVLAGIYEDSKGRIWLASQGGLYQWLPEADTFRFFPITLPESAGMDEALILTKFSEAADGSFWLFPALYQRGYAIHFDPETGTYEVVSDEGYRFGNYIEKGPTPEELWFGARPGKGKLTIFNTHTRQLKTVDIQVDGVNFLVSNRIESLLRDRSGNMWIAVQGGGLLKFDPMRNNFHWLRFQPEKVNSLSHSAVNGLDQDGEGRYWLSTFGGGLHRWDRENNTIVNYRAQPENPNSPLSNYLLGLEVASDGKIWYGEGFSAGYYDPATGQFGHYREVGTVRSVHESRQNRLWLAKHSGGLRVYDPSSDNFIKIGIPDPADPDNLIYSNMGGIFQDSYGYLWLGSHSPWHGGFFRFNPETQQFDIFDLPEAHDFCQGRRGFIWIASVNGLYRFDPETEDFLRYGEADGLASNVLQAIEEDDAGRLWIATDNGLSRFDPETKTFRNYYQSDGLPSNKFYYPSYKNEAGELFFWGEFGVLYFHPDSIRDNPVPPKLAFTGLDLFGQPLSIVAGSPLDKHISLLRQIDLSHWQNDLTIHYAALHFKNPEKNKYQVKLDNYDDDWRDTGHQRFADYTNLDPGRYTFRVRAANSDGIWNEEGIALGITIFPPWYWNTWSQLIYALVLIGTLYWFYRFQLNRRLALAEAARLKELDSFKTKLYTNITHEFRTPLTVIQGMMDNIKGYDEEKDIVKRNSQNLLNLINRLLGLSKLDAGKMELNLVQGDILPFLRYVTESFHSYALNQKINLYFHSEADEAIMDYDPEKILEVLSNLLSNALKFTPEYGKIQVVASVQPVENHQRGIHSDFRFPTSDFLQISVTDTGIGIASDRLPHIFDRFYQTEAENTRRAEGTGIGLSLVKELVELMDGVIEVESTLGEGAKFLVKLPVTREAELVDERLKSPGPLSPTQGFGERGKGESPHRPLEAVATAALQSLPAQATGPTNRSCRRQGYDGQGESAHTILIVEDNRDVMHYLTTCLSSLSFGEPVPTAHREDQGQACHLLYARNGREGIAQALEHIPDIIISDVMMPEVDGFELCKTLKQDERSSHIPIILLTARSDMASKLEGLEHGADAYLAKPFQREELEVRLRKLVELRQKLQARYNQADFQLEPATQKEDAFVLKIKNHVQDKLEDESFGIEELSKAMHLSRGHLHRKVKALTGKTPSHFMRQIRLQEAYKLLKEGSLNVSEVAYQVGYKDPNYFSRLFSKAYGKPPSEV